LRRVLPAIPYELTATFYTVIVTTVLDYHIAYKSTMHPSLQPHTVTLTTVLDCLITMTLTRLTKHRLLQPHAVTRKTFLDCIISLTYQPCTDRYNLIQSRSPLFLTYHNAYWVDQVPFATTSYSHAHQCTLRYDTCSQVTRT